MLSFITLILFSCKKDIKEKPSNINTINTLYINVSGSKEIQRDKWQNSSLLIKDDSNEEIFNSTKLRVRGRGNSTWNNIPSDYQKRPYRIRFDEDTSILGMKLSRDYVLLAEHFDRSLLRNYFAHRMSQDLNIGYKLETRPIELYVNGEYHGYYTLTEQIETHNEKLKIDTNGQSGGFLIELEADDRIGEEGTEDINWVRVNDRNYVIKSPDMDDLSLSDAYDKTYYIKTYFDLLYKSLETNYYDKYIDVDKFIDYFILNEIAKQIDINWSSVYSYKDKDQKLIMGPIWDFDLGYGNANYGEKEGILFESHEGFWMNGNQWFDQAMKNEEFRSKYNKRFKEVLNKYFDDWMIDLQSMYELISDAGDRNFDRWQILDVDMWPVTDNALLLNSHEEHYLMLRDYLYNRKAWLLNNIK